ncbi:hypothetical protein [Pseudobacteriovorax antillogorgiicola]|nr:hypothetical protein [Pseudobacteriovorax antillogorgiicola]
MDGKLKKRPFGEQAIAALVVWGELDQRLVDQPICEDCYEELRETLIERESEIPNAAQTVGQAS